MYSILFSLIKSLIIFVAQLHFLHLNRSQISYVSLVPAELNTKLYLPRFIYKKGKKIANQLNNFMKRGSVFQRYRFCQSNQSLQLNVDS